MDLKQELGRAAGFLIRDFLIPGVERCGWPALFDTARSVPGALVAPGLHPLAADQWDGEVETELDRFLDDPKTVAVGEIGLDGLLDFPPPGLQEEALRGQLRLAVSRGRPVVIHCRKAMGRLLAILKEEGAQQVGGIAHAFSGSPETALELVRLGFAIGFGGTLTYPGAKRASEVLAKLPEDWVVLETDAPDMAPWPHRGKPNRPAYLALVAERVAALRGWTLEETARITSANARRVLRLQVTGDR